MTRNELIRDGIAVTLHELVAHVDAYAEQLVRAQFGVSYSHYHFLAVASTLDDPDVTSLADCLGVSKAAVSKRLDGMVADGWITLGSDPHHARRVLIRLTPGARQLVGDATVLLETEFSDALGELPPGEIEALNARLRVLLDIFVRKHEAPR